MPKITRPSDRWSSSAISSAILTGSCQGSTTTMVPSPARVVRPAM